MFFRDEQYQLNALQNPIGSREETLKVTTTVLYKLYWQMVKYFEYAFTKSTKDSRPVFSRSSYVSFL